MELLPEIEVWYGLPAIRRKIAVGLKEKGLSQREIAQKLDLRESAVSQYVSGKRGNSRFPKSLSKEFESAVNNILDGDPEIARQEILKLAAVLRDTRAICEIHKQHSDDLPEKCDSCFHN